MKHEDGTFSRCAVFEDLKMKMGTEDEMDIKAAWHKCQGVALYRDARGQNNESRF